MHLFKLFKNTRLQNDPSKHFVSRFWSKRAKTCSVKMGENIRLFRVYYAQIVSIDLARNGPRCAPILGLGLRPKNCLLGCASPTY